VRWVALPPAYPPAGLILGEKDNSWAVRMLKVSFDRSAVTSIEYAMVAGALAFVLFEVMQMPAEALANVVTGLFAGVGGHGPGG